MVKIGLLIVASILVGILGRIGGKGKPYRSWMRDWLIPVIFISILLWFKPQSLNLRSLMAYLIGFLALGASLTTYWDFLFGFDNLWLSGFIVGLSAIPFLWCGIALWVIIGRTLILAIIWGSLNKIKYDRILFWRRDVAEEFLRYTSIIVTLFILLI